MKFFKVGIVAMHHGARLNIHIRKANGDVVLQNRLAFLYCPSRNFVARRYLATAGEMLTWYFSANANINSGHDDVVIGV